MNGSNGVLNSLPITYGKNWIRWKKTDTVIVWFSRKLEVVTNGVPEVSENTNDAQRVTHKDAKKKDCKAAFCIQFAVDATIFDRIYHTESAKEA